MRVKLRILEVPFFSSIDELLQSDLEIDVVNICTPNGLHASQSLKALEKRKHVVCEKPMGLSKDNCEKLFSRHYKVSRQVFVSCRIGIRPFRVDKVNC